MPYTIRLIVRVKGTKRIIKPFVRAEYALNVSSHATRFDTVNAADAAADIVADNMWGTGHTVLGSDVFEV